MSLYKQNYQEYLTMNLHGKLMKVHGAKRTMEERNAAVIGRHVCYMLFIFVKSYFLFPKSLSYAERVGFRCDTQYNMAMKKLPRTSKQKQKSRIGMQTKRTVFLSRSNHFFRIHYSQNSLEQNLLQRPG